jgi:hypothetical protein
LRAANYKKVSPEVVELKKQLEDAQLEARRAAKEAKELSNQLRKKTGKREFNPRPLTAGESLFLAESLKPGMTMAQAARNVGFKRTPNKNRVVRRHRQEFIDRQMKAADISAERTLTEIARVAYFDPRKMFDETGNLIPVTEMDNDTAAAIAGMDIEKRTEGRGENAETYYILKVKIAPKVAALELLTKLDVERQKANGGSLQPPQVQVNFVAPTVNVSFEGASTQ